MPDLLANMHDHAALADVLRSGSTSAYLDFVERGRSHQRIVGDFTPAYSLLPVVELAELARLRPDVRFIYLMRDPVRRLWSHVRMMAARRTGNGTASQRRCLRILRRTRLGREPSIAARSDYRRAIEALSDATQDGQVLLAFYEDLFTETAPKQICEFLGIRPLASDRKTLVHEGQAIDLPEEHRAQARLWLAPQYDYVAKVKGRVPETWQMD